ncbi:MAG: hypothetical protein CMJ95_09610 [Planctomycetes bacterium]|nr:hypothetical protein [Planctomycetota bacterium]
MTRAVTDGEGRVDRVPEDILDEGNFVSVSSRGSPDPCDRVCSLADWEPVREIARETVVGPG